ncbi:MAG: hypothetical protein BWX50_00719 [Euryarchaeota archaeon ADurb.Bin009]|nr:MAG: hypothetical protein BWX50_00719 [Euryarchaeota archaeon ADurb.Bin009]
MPEHPHDVLVVDPVSRVDHDGLIRGAEEEDVSTARHLEAEDLDGIAEPDTLEIRVEPVPGGIPKRPSRGEDGLEDLFWVLAEAVEFLDDMVDVMQKREQKPILRRPDQPPHRLGEPDVEDGVVEFLAGHVVLDDIETVARLETVEQALHDRGLLDVQADGDPPGVAPPVVEVDVGDVCPRTGDVGEELEEGAGLVGQVEGELEEPERRKRLLEIADGVEVFFHLYVGLRRRGHLKEDRGRIDPPVVLDAVDVPRVRLDDIGGTVERARLVGHSGDEGVLGHPVHLEISVLCSRPISFFRQKWS